MGESPPVVTNPLFFLDYDGTLAPIVDEPMQAFPHPDIPPILEELAKHHPLWIVTGRYLNDLEQLVDHSFQAIGLHGIQRGRLHGSTGYDISDASREDISMMRRTAPESDGIAIEEKGPMFALHYRRSPDKKAAKDAIWEWLEDLPETLDAILGKDVVELRPKGVSKGTAVSEIAQRHERQTPLYIGDDVTDEDAFRALDENAVTIKVGEGKTAARYRVRGVEDVVAYLRQYL